MVTRVLEKYLGDSSKRVFCMLPYRSPPPLCKKYKRKKFLSPLCRNIISNKFEQKCKDKKIQIKAQLSLKKDKICPPFSPHSTTTTMYYDIEKKY